MSTKIYNAYKYRRTIFDLVSWLNKTRKVYEEQAIENTNFLLKGKIPFCNYDNEYKIPLWVKGYKSNSKYLSKFALYSYITKANDSSMNDIWNMKASVVVYPYEEMLIVHFFNFDFGLKGPKNPLINRVKKNHNFSDYSYWNNSDMPENVTEEEWKERERIYDKIFGIRSTPDSVGFIYEFANWDSLMRVCSEVAKMRDKEKTISEIDFWSENKE
jgi:hypothetical protein